LDVVERNALAGFVCGLDESGEHLPVSDEAQAQNAIAPGGNMLGEFVKRYQEI